MRQLFDINDEVWNALSLEDVVAFTTDLKLNGTYALPYEHDIYLRLHGVNNIFGGEEIIPEFQKTLGMARVDQYMEVGPLGSRGRFDLHNWVFVFDFEKQATAEFALQHWRQAGKITRRVRPTRIEVVYTNDDEANEPGADKELDDYLCDGLIAILAWKTLEKRVVHPGVKERFLQKRTAPLHITTYITFGRRATETTGTTGTRRPPRMHYRRSHVAQVPHGPGRALRKEITRPAVWVMYDEAKFGEMPLRTEYKIRPRRNANVQQGPSKEAAAEPSTEGQDDF